MSEEEKKYYDMAIGIVSIMSKGTKWSDFGISTFEKSPAFCRGVSVWKG